MTLTTASMKLVNGHATQHPNPKHVLTHDFTPVYALMLFSKDNDLIPQSGRMQTVLNEYIKLDLLLEVLNQFTIL